MAKRKARKVRKSERAKKRGKKTTKSCREAERIISHLKREYGSTGVRDTGTTVIIPNNKGKNWYVDKRTGRTLLGRTKGNAVDKTPYVVGRETGEKIAEGIAKALKKREQERNNNGKRRRWW